MPKIVLATINAKFIHASFGLRYLLANLGELQSEACIQEFETSQRPVDIVETLLIRRPEIIGFGVYIWNATQTLEVVRILRKVAPDIRIVAGGPEVSYEFQEQPLLAEVDYLVTGEADLSFAQLALQLLAGSPPKEKIVRSPLPDLALVKMPYAMYTDRDVAHRIIYVEASRGCPFTCEFCLSSLDIPVRQFPLETFLEEMQRLLDRGVEHFKFVDRTFNLNVNVSRAILEFFLQRYKPGQFFHFEMVPDRLPEPLREIIARFPPGSLQFEVGIQTFNPEVAKLISRRQNYQRLEENFLFLRSHTGVHIHADLIAGLPGETLESFAAGFDRLVRLRPQEIQVGILKRLRGTPIVRHDTEWEMVYNTTPPYELLQNKSMSYRDMQMLRRFSRHWDLVANSGNFLETTPLLWGDEESPFAAFLRFSEWLFARTGRTHGIALTGLAEALFIYLTNELHLHPLKTAPVLLRDYQRAGRSDIPPFLRHYLPADEGGRQEKKSESIPLKRQARHLPPPIPK